MPKKTSKTAAKADLSVREEFEALFKRAKTSDRFELLLNLPLSALLKLSPFPKLWEFLSLADLFEQDSKQVLETVANSAKALVTLTEFLKIHLKETDISAKSESLSPELPARQRPDKPRLVMNSVEAENRLIEILTKLEHCEHFAQIAHSRLGEFWDPARPRAPFEEAMTLKQLKEMKLAHLLEKRSFNAEKIVSIGLAVDRAMRGQKTSALPLQSGSIQGEEPMVSTQKFIDSGQYTPAHGKAVLKLVEAESSRLGRDTSLIANLMRQLPSVFLDREFALLWFAYDHESALVAQIFKLDMAETEEMLRAHRAKLADYCSKALPRLKTLLEICLAGPGLEEQRLFEALLNGNTNTECGQMMVRILVQALGAAPAQAFGQTLEASWTIHTKALENCLHSLLLELPKSETEVEAYLGNLASGLRTKDLIGLLKLRAHHNEKTRSWISKEFNLDGNKRDKRNSP